jgi:hypothetical protein
MRVERHDDGGGPSFVGDPLQPIENLAMSAVQAVEVAERQHRLLPVRRTRIVGKMDDVHD